MVFQTGGLHESDGQFKFTTYRKFEYTARRLYTYFDIAGNCGVIERLFTRKAPTSEDRFKNRCTSHRAHLSADNTRVLLLDTRFAAVNDRLDVIFSDHIDLREVLRVSFGSSTRRAQGRNLTEKILQELAQLVQRHC